MFSLEANIIRQTPCGAGFYLLELEAPDVSSRAAPGQFVMVRVGDDYDPLLRRPLSVHDAGDGRIRLLYRVVGKGTGRLSRRGEGERVGLLGPLGNGFEVRPPLDTAALVAGGRGVAPMLFLARRIRRECPSARLILFFGARTGEELVRLEAFENLNVEMRLATEDGSKGTKGLVTQLVRGSLLSDAEVRIYACGPMPMLKALGPVAAEQSIPAQVSLEAHMSCGLGVCRGCVVKTKNGYAHVCQDGPVFPLDAPDWEVRT
ncbi:MAG: dihydroorotate dehydrogenase electron transfer subunit [Deltaproteobacteria bacterium]|nr:dihydroorotate dehydrogenase electron transfer subunit [Deltaproteobacteria bacterium]